MLTILVPPGDSASAPVAAALEDAFHLLSNRVRVIGMATEQRRQTAMIA
jgi:hypothetical protein